MTPQGIVGRLNGSITAPDSRLSALQFLDTTGLKKKNL